MLNCWKRLFGKKVYSEIWRAIPLCRSDVEYLERKEHAYFLRQQAHDSIAEAFVIVIFRHMVADCQADYFEFFRFY